MADTSLKSLTFPGLPNRYIIPQIDNTLSQSGYAADAKETGDALNEHEEALETKAEIDGYYEEMTVGDAEQLVATQFIEDSVPYLYRTSGDSADIGNREYDSIVGGSVAWNQMIATSNIRASGSVLGLTLTNNTDGTFTLDGTSTNTSASQFTVLTTNKTITSGHVYLSDTGQSTLNAYWNVGGMWTTKAKNVYKATASSNGNLYISVPAETTVSNLKITPQLFDLTAMFGTTIADYIYSLEQATAGVGVAFFRKLFPKDYYEYNAGELLHVGGISAHEMVGFNQYNSTTGTAKVVGGMQYQITGTYTAISVDGTAITPDSSGFFTPTANGTLIVTGGNDSDTCVHLVWSGTRNGEYEPYEKHTYALDDSLTLRGIPKLDSSDNIYWDGDTYEPDGTVTRRYGVVDMGTLSWSKNTTSSGHWRFTGRLSTMKQNTSVSLIGNCLSNEYVSVSPNDTWIGTKGVTLNQSTPDVLIVDENYSDASAFKTAMSGVYLVYELATPTTEEATPYNEVQIVDDWGTEEYVSTGIVPVGHKTKYPSNLRDKLQHLPNLASADGVYAIQQSGTQMSLTYIPTAVSELPDAPTTDGTYTLKATVSDGTPTYTWEAD